jgi:hypothetical protein
MLVAFRRLKVARGVVDLFDAAPAELVGHFTLVVRQAHHERTRVRSP